MPKQEIGVMGYVGERIVEKWLTVKYPSRQYEIIKQIRPIAISPKGGPYLDFGVARKGCIEKIFEVKSQNYIFAGPVNKALKYIWKNNNKKLEYITNEGKKYLGSKYIDARLILLVAPNREGKKAIGKDDFKKKVILFYKIWKDLDERFNRTELLNYLLGHFKKNAEEVIEILKSPTIGKEITKEFGK